MLPQQHALSELLNFFSEPYEQL